MHMPNIQCWTNYWDFLFEPTFIQFINTVFDYSYAIDVLSVVTSCIE